MICVCYLQNGIIYQINVSAVITVGLPQHLQQRRPIFWTHAPQRSLSHRLEQAHVKYKQQHSNMEHWTISLIAEPLSCDNCSRLMWVSHLILVSLKALEALAQWKVVPDRIPPSSSCWPVVREVVLDPFVDIFDWKPFVGRLFNGHEYQTAERVRGLGWGVACRPWGLKREFQLGQWVGLDYGLQWQQVAPLVQPAEAGQVILVGHAESLCAVSIKALWCGAVWEWGRGLDGLCRGWGQWCRGRRERGGRQWEQQTAIGAAFLGRGGEGERPLKGAGKRWGGWQCVRATLHLQDGKVEDCAAAGR